MVRHLSVAAAVLTLATVAACSSSEPDAVSTTTSASATTSAPGTAAGEGGAWTERSLAYATRVAGGEPLKLDIYFPAEPADAPIVFGYYPDLVEQGMIVVDRRGDITDHPGGPEAYVANRPRVRFWAEQGDCAIRFARARVAELGNEDPTVVLTGFSFTGGVAAHVALFGDTLETRWEEFAAAGGPPRQLDCTVPGGSTDVDVLIGIAGAYDLSVPIFDEGYGRAYQQEHDPEKQELLASAIGANPDLRIRLIHGIGDFVPVEHIEEFAAVLLDAGYDVRLTTWAARHDEPPMEILLPILMEALDAAEPDPEFDLASDSLCDWFTAEDMNRIIAAAQDRAGLAYVAAPFTDCRFDEGPDAQADQWPRWSAQRPAVHRYRVDLVPIVWRNPDEPAPTLGDFTAHEMLDESVTYSQLEYDCTWLENVSVQLRVEGHEDDALWFRLSRGDELSTYPCAGEAQFASLALAVADAMLRAMNWVD